MTVLPGHAVWDVLDLERTRKLLAREPYTLDPRSQAVVWRLATIVAADMPSE
jgi:hypothetical protein